MIGAAARRIGWTIIVVWFVVTTSFLLTALIPADPARALLGPHATSESLERVRVHYCLDRGVVGQYGCWLGHVARGDLGESYRSKRPVIEIIADRIWPTVQLAFGGLILQVVLGVPLGILGAVRRGRWPDHGATVLALIGQSVPQFFVGTVLLYVFAYRWGWFPIGGYGAGGWDRALHLVLPAMTLATGGMAFYSRVVRSELIDALGEDYVRTARAKGLRESTVIGRHALRNALGPLITLIGLELGVLLGGAVVIELIFAWPGLGRELMQAILELDLPLILGVVVVGTVAIAVVNLVVDLIYLWIDPRLREAG